jgi:predicted GNAT family N-acyltransferase
MIPMLEIRRFTSQEKDLAEMAFRIRREVFVGEQQVDPAKEYDGFEDSAVHFLAFDNGVPVAAARWRHTDKGIKLERFAVLKQYRSKGVGAAVLQKVLEDVKPYNKEIYLHSQLSAVPFYQKWGFSKVGDMFYEADIQHFVMIYSKGAGK